MFRRDLFLATLQALFLALFPWLRNSPRGLLVAREAAEWVWRWSIGWAFHEQDAIGTTGLLSRQPADIRQAIRQTEMEHYTARPVWKYGT